MSTQFEYFAACAPGLEPVLRSELGRLGLEARAASGGVEGRTGWPGLWDLHLGSAVAESTRVRLKSFKANSFAALEAGLGRLPWHAFLWREQALDVRVICHKSKLYHSDAVAERVHRVIGARLARGRKPERAVPAARVHLRLSHDVVTPSIDSSGDRMHLRGYRTHVERAPLRETLAASMVQLLDGLVRRTAQPSTAQPGTAQPGTTDPSTALWDPFCGSGVLPLEWLRHASGVLPGAERAFAFETWPTHDAATWQRHKDDAIRAKHVAQDAHAWGSDLDAKAIASSRSNAERGHLLQHTTFWQADFKAALDRVPQGAAVLANPPYGKRIGSPERARGLFAELARTLDARPDLGPAVIACPNERWLDGKRSWEVLARTRHGGVPLLFVGTC
jgi:putative N6-adenine-specific DNA methylase